MKRPDEESRVVHRAVFGFLAPVVSDDFAISSSRFGYLLRTNMLGKLRTLDKR